MLKVTSIDYIFYLGAVMEVIVLFVLVFFFEEKLDIENLERRGALKKVEESPTFKM